MANAITFIDRFGHDYSDLVLGGVVSTDLGVGKREINLTKTDTLQIGSVVAADGTEATSAANAYGVLVNTNVAFDLSDIATGEVFTGVVVKAGYTLNRFLVVGTDGAAVSDEWVEALEAKGLKLTEKVLFTS